MTGKVFNDTTNIYQDQAKILFDYYKTAAEKIVSAEIKEEQKRDDLTKGLKTNQQKNQISKILLIVCFGAALVFAVLGVFLPWLFIFTAAGIGLGIKFLIDFLTSKKNIQSYTDDMQKTFDDFTNIRRDYKVDKIGVVYVPIATHVPFNNKSFLLDHTGNEEETDFNLTKMNQPDEFKTAIKKLTEGMEALPIVETNDDIEEIDTSEYSKSIQNVVLNDYVGNIDRQVRNIGFLLEDSYNISVSIPAIPPKGERAEFIKEYATNDTKDYPVVKAFDVSFEDKMEKFSSVNALMGQLNDAEGYSNDEYLKDIMKQLAETVQIFTQTKMSGSSKLMQYTAGIFDNVLKSGYTQYSPRLEAEEIERIRTADFNYKTSVDNYTPFNLKESSVVKYDMFSNNWVAEDGSRTSMPFGMHQIDKEIFMPVIEALMTENRKERLRIYNNIEDQKRGYVERWSSEVGNYFRDNRKAADDLITEMQKAYSDYMSSNNMFKSFQETSKAMQKSKKIEDGEVKEIDEQAEMIAGFEVQAEALNQKQEEFSDFMDRIQDNISDSTTEFSHVDYFEGLLRDGMAHDTAVAISNIHEIDSRRQKLASVSPYLANYAELPPEPDISDEMFKQININLIQRAAAESRYRN